MRARRHTRRKDTLLLLLVHVVGGGHDHVLPIEEQEERCQWRARDIYVRSVDPETKVEQKEELEQEEEEEEEGAGGSLFSNVVERVQAVRFYSARLQPRAETTGRGEGGGGRRPGGEEAASSR